MIGPYFAQLSEEFDGKIVFVKIDVDTNAVRAGCGLVFAPSLARELGRSLAAVCILCCCLLACLSLAACWCVACACCVSAAACGGASADALVCTRTRPTRTQQEVAAECGVSAMPTFQVFRDGAKVAEFVGASKDKLKAMVEQHLS